jgi:hypothetical protein
MIMRGDYFSGQGRFSEAEADFNRRICLPLKVVDNRCAVTQHLLEGIDC